MIIAKSSLLWTPQTITTAPQIDNCSSQHTIQGGTGDSQNSSCWPKPHVSYRNWSLNIWFWLNSYFSPNSQSGKDGKKLPPSNLYHKQGNTALIFWNMFSFLVYVSITCPWIDPNTQTRAAKAEHTELNHQARGPDPKYVF